MSERYPLTKRRKHCGRKLPGRVAIIAELSRLTLSDIARIYSKGRITKRLKGVVEFGPFNANSGLNGPTSQRHLRYTLQGRRNTPRYVRALEEAWLLPISDLRRMYAEDRANPPDPMMGVQFRKWYLEEVLLKAISA